jgi:hypothetical protein
VKETTLESMQGCVHCEDKVMTVLALACHCGRGTDIVHAVYQLWPLHAVCAESMLVYWALVVHRNVINELAKIAGCTLTVGKENKSWVDVSLAALTAKWPWFVEDSEWHFVCAFTVVKLTWLCQWLAHNSEFDPTHCLHELILGRSHHCRPHKPRWCSSFVD